MTKTTYLNIPNTSINHDKVRQVVSQFMVEEVLTKDQIMELAMTYLEDTYAEAGHSIGDLAKMVKETPIKENNANFYPEQALHFGPTGFSEGALYFYVSNKDHHTNIVKEEVR